MDQQNAEYVLFRYKNDWNNGTWYNRLILKTLF
jgi:hypothetical protein